MTRIREEEDRILSELQRRFADETCSSLLFSTGQTAVKLSGAEAETCSIYHGMSALNPQSKQFLEEHQIAALATHYQASLQDLSAETHTAGSCATALCCRLERHTGMEMKTSPVPFHWFHSRPVPTGSSENVNHSHPKESSMALSRADRHSPTHSKIQKGS